MSDDVASVDHDRPDPGTGTIVIVGSGQAGGWAAQTLRSEGFRGKVVMIGDERHYPYERPPLSKAVLSGQSSAESCALMKHDAFVELNLDWRPNTRVDRLDLRARQVVLSTAESIAFDKLILCNGGRARKLKVPGMEIPGVFTLRNLDDARALGGALLPGKKLVVVGGGWVGLEVASTARGKEMDVAVVEATARLCERSVPPEASAYLARLHAQNGTRVMLGAGVLAIVRNADGTLLVHLSDGSDIPADAVLVGVGMIPNDELARDAGLVCDGGIVVDAQCRTSDPNIFAAGDVASWHCEWAGRRMRLESWQNAQEQGIAAAQSALGRDVIHQPLPWFWSDQYGVNLQIYGMPDASHRMVARGDLLSDSFVLFYLDGDKVKSALGPGSARDLKFARRLIASGKSVEAARLSDLSVAMAKQ